MSKPNRVKWLVIVVLVAIQIGHAQSWEPMLPMDATLKFRDLCFLNDGLHGWAVGSILAGNEMFSDIFCTIDGMT